MTGPTVANIQIDELVAVITMTNGPANALSDDLVVALDEAVDAAIAAEARVIVFVSEVDNFFAAGADLKLLATVDSEGFDLYLTRLRALIERIAALPQITIAAIDGMALGGGLELALACTMRLASPGAKLGVPEVKLGLLPGAGGTQRLPHLIGRRAALDLLLTGRSITGEHAATLGLVDNVFDEGKVADAAIGLAKELAGGPQLALAAIVRCVDAAQDLPLSDGMTVERDEIRRLFSTDDAAEGIAAFIERRQAIFE